MRRLLIISGCFVLVLILFFAVAYLRTGKPKITVNYVEEFNKISKPKNYDPNQNAAPYYEKAFELFVTEPNQIQNKEDLLAWPADLTEEKRILFRKWISDNNQAVTQIKFGTEKLYNWKPYEGKSFSEIIICDLALARKSAYVICWQAKLNAFDGNSAHVFSDLAIAYKLGSHFQGRKLLIVQLVGTQINRLAVETAFQILNETKFDSEQLKNAQGNFEILYAAQPFPMDWTADKFFINDNIQRIFTDDGKGGGHIYGTRFFEDSYLPQFHLGEYWSKDRKQYLKKYKRQQAVEVAEKLYSFCDQIRHKSPYQLHNEGTNLEKIMKEMTKDDPLLSLLSPAIRLVSTMSYNDRTNTRALITTLGILRYKAEKHEYPATLQELLAAGYIKELSIDPFSGEPLVYKRTADNFILYSVGENFVDDGGTHSEWGTDKGDYVFWPVQANTKEKQN